MNDPLSVNKYWLISFFSKTDPTQSNTITSSALNKKKFSCNFFVWLTQAQEYAFKNLYLKNVRNKIVRKIKFQQKGIFSFIKDQVEDFSPIIFVTDQKCKNIKLLVKQKKFLKNNSSFSVRILWFQAALIEQKLELVLGRGGLEIEQCLITELSLPWQFNSHSGHDCDNKSCYFDIFLWC